MAILEGVCRKGAGVYDQDVQIRKGTYFQGMGWDMENWPIKERKENRKNCVMLHEHYLLAMLR